MGVAIAPQRLGELGAQASEVDLRTALAREGGDILTPSDAAHRGSG